MQSLGSFRKVIVAAALLSVVGTAAYGEATAGKYRPPVANLEVSEKEPLPPGFSVQATDVDGPVFVDARGMTLYSWPFKALEMGQVGDRKDKPSTCTDTKFTETTGYMSIYPPGLVLPELESRPTCLQAWPAVLAGPDAKAIGKWTVVDRADGHKQWAYEGMPLYTSILDTKPGQVNGGFRKRITDGMEPPFRVPVGPEPALPPAFRVRTMVMGRILVSSTGYVIFSSDADKPNVSNCKEACLKKWAPAVAAQVAQPQGEWGLIERSPGVKQWTFRSMPVYTYVLDRKRTTAGMAGTSLIGMDLPGWHPVYTQKWPDPPKEFTVQDSRIGQVLADKNGMTLYTYLCSDDALDQLSCDHPSQTQAYRVAICGRGDVAACNKLFAYVQAPKDPKIDSMIWGTAWIDPQTGHYATASAPGAMHVWTFRDRPVYTHSRDKKPGDAYGDAWGENGGLRNGFKAFWVRDDFNGNAD